MNINRAFMQFVLVACCFTSHAVAFDLKGYALGAEMTLCPADLLSQSQEADDSTSCMLPIDTLGNSKTIGFKLQIYSGRINMLFVGLRDRGLTKHSTLVDALKDKFGEPTHSHPLLNRYEWRNGPYMLMFDGMQGAVMAVDVAVAAQLRQRRAAQSKPDL